MLNKIKNFLLLIWLLVLPIVAIIFFVLAAAWPHTQINTPFLIGFGVFIFSGIGWYIGVQKGW